MTLFTSYNNLAMELLAGSSGALVMVRVPVYFRTSRYALQMMQGYATSMRKIIFISLYLWELLFMDSALALW